MNAMRRSDRRPGLMSPRTVLGLLPLAAACAGLIAARPAAGQAPKDQAGGTTAKRVLFDGKTLDGWKKTDFYHAGEVKVDDGRIVLAAGDSMTGITTTRQDLPTTDYELTYEAMRTSGSDFFAAATFPVGKSYITLVNGGWGGYVTGLSSLNGMDASENETTSSFKYQEKTWYRFRVRVTGEAIRCWVGDKEVIAVNHKEKHVGTRVETRPNEPLGFATWKTAGALRNIEIRALSPDEIATTDKID
jgi:hypothetical protein